MESFFSFNMYSSVIDLDYLKICQDFDFSVWLNDVIFLET